MDTIGWAIAMLHNLIGHDKAAAALGVPAGDKRACLICQYERNPAGQARQAVITALSPAKEGGAR
jgi:hypothetical protein